MSTSSATVVSDVSSTTSETLPATSGQNEPVVSQLDLPPVSSGVSGVSTAPSATTSSVENPFKPRTSFSLPSLTVGLGTLSATATSSTPAITSEAKTSSLESWKERLKSKDKEPRYVLSDPENIGSFEAGGGSGPHGVNPSTMVYSKPEVKKGSDLEATGISLGAGQRMVFEAARKRAQANSEADKESLASPFASGDPFSRPKVQDVQRFPYEPSSPDVATAENIEYIRADLVRAGVPTKDITFAMWDIARYCADAGSSESTEFVGTSSYGGRVARMEIAAVIKKHTTLRRFCGFYAKIVWNIMLVTNIPPSGWMKKGYEENTKFAAFDFFVHVSNNAALEPENGLVRKPYHEELVAAQVNKGVILHRTEAAQDKNASTAHEVTGGRAGPRSRLTLKGKELD
uniref:Capsid protein n=1 Tax=Asian prunus virus 1 TaxID=351427 RepID=Q2I7I4_9VIRU|nr:coat protein [Asian prunus virus 1]